MYCIIMQVLIQYKLITTHLHLVCMHLYKSRDLDPLAGASVSESVSTFQ